jgi:methyl-accepting chemotaxis protein
LIRVSDEANQTVIKVGAGRQKAVSMVGEIGSAMREQTRTSHNIALQIENVAQVSEEGSAAAKESAHSATVLQELSSDLKNVVSAYRI